MILSYFHQRLFAAMGVDCLAWGGITEQRELTVIYTRERMYIHVAFKTVSIADLISSMASSVRTCYATLNMITRREKGKESVVV